MRSSHSYRPYRIICEVGVIVKSTEGEKDKEVALETDVYNGIICATKGVEEGLRGDHQICTVLTKWHYTVSAAGQHGRSVVLGRYYITSLQH